MKLTPDQYLKAITGAALAGLTALGTALADGHVTGVEYVGVAVALVGTFGVVFGTTNADS